MRVWDVSPGYLNRGSLLGEHRELHGLHSILLHGKKGYSHHPETVRWVGCIDALARRHALLAAEMRLRGYVDRTPLQIDPERTKWPVVFVTPPLEQVELLRSKYVDRATGRIPLPKSIATMWAQHETSVLARDAELHRSFARRAARASGRRDFAALAQELILALRRTPNRRGRSLAIERMWSLVARHATAEDRRIAEQSEVGRLAKTQELAHRLRERRLLESTALGELGASMDGAP